MSVIDCSGKEQFEKLIKETPGIILVDFWASWCGPCRMLGPVLHDIAEKSDGAVTVVKIDVDEDANAEIAMHYQVRSIPQVTIFTGGKQVDQFVGALPPEQVQEYIAKWK